MIESENDSSRNRDRLDAETKMSSFSCRDHTFSKAIRNREDFNLGLSKSRSCLTFQIENSVSRVKIWFCWIAGPTTKISVSNRFKAIFAEVSRTAISFLVELRGWLIFMPDAVSIFHNMAILHYARY